MHQRVGVGIKHFDRLDVVLDLARIADRLRIIGGEHALRQRQFLKAELHPIGAERSARIGPRRFDRLRSTLKELGEPYV